VYIIIHAKFINIIMLHRWPFAYLLLVTAEKRSAPFCCDRFTEESGKTLGIVISIDITRACGETSRTTPLHIFSSSLHRHRETKKGYENKTYKQENDYNYR
jgi:hypothetical protein